MTSAIVFGLVSAVATNHHFMDPGLLVGLIFFSCVATTISSNVVMTRQAHGNTALTVVQTTIGNLIGVFVTPALVVMYTSVDTWYNKILPPASGDWGGIYRRVLEQLGLSIYLPLVVGQVTRNLFPKTCKKVFMDWKLNKLGSICLLTLLWATYDQAFATNSFERVSESNMIFIVFISVALWIVFFGITFASTIFWLPREDIISLCMCVPAKGIVMGVPLSTTIFGGIDLALQSRVQIPIVIYQGLQLAFASILVPIFRRWVARATQEDQESEPPPEPPSTTQRGTQENY
jgi:sodium/bile acid cotransporter 7